MPDETPAEAVVAFPALSKGPAVFYESERHEVWVGLPLRQTIALADGLTQELPCDQLMTTLALDRAKYEAVLHLLHDRQELIEAHQRKQELSQSGVLTRVGAGLKHAAAGLVRAGQQAVSLKL